MPKEKSPEPVKIEVVSVASFGARLAWVRKQKGLTQKQLADLAGVHENTVLRLETKEDANVRVDTINILANVLKVDPAWLAFGFASRSVKLVDTISRMTKVAYYDQGISFAQEGGQHVAGV